MIRNINMGIREMFYRTNKNIMDKIKYLQLKKKILSSLTNSELEILYKEFINKDLYNIKREINSDKMVRVRLNRQQLIQKLHFNVDLDIICEHNKNAKRLREQWI